MFVAIGVVKKVIEDEEGSVKEEVISRLVEITSSTKEILLARMAEEMVEILKETDMATLLCEISGVPLSYEVLSWKSVMVSIDVLSVEKISKEIQETDTWKDHVRTGPAEAIKEVIEILKSEVADRLEVVNNLDAHLTDVLVQIDLSTN
jgi:hypothetical protein